MQDHLARYWFATQWVSGRRVLDIACGMGDGSRMLVEAGAAHVDGVELSPDAVAYARDHYQLPNLAYLAGNIQDYAAEHTYDVIVSFETIEHVDDYQRALDNLSSLLADDGLLIISTPNRLITSPQARSLNDPPQNHFHRQEFTRDEFRAALDTSGFTIQSEYGQRQQRHFRQRVMRGLYKRLFKPDHRTSPEVQPIRPHLMPRYMIFLAQKAETKK